MLTSSTALRDLHRSLFEGIYHPDKLNLVNQLAILGNISLKMLSPKAVYLLLGLSIFSLLAYLSPAITETFNPNWNPSVIVANLNGSLEDPNVSFNPVFNSTLHIYTIDGKPILFLYWNNNIWPPHIQLSLETIKCHAHNEVHIVLGNTQFAMSQLNESKEQFSWLIPAHQADYYRSSMLLKYGGMYMDLDTIQTNSVRYLFDHLMKWDVFGADWTPENAPISITNIGPMRAANILLTKWKTQADKILKDKSEQLKKTSTLHLQLPGSGYPMAWAEILGSIWLPIMRDLIANKQINFTFIEGVSTIGQLITQGYLPLLFQPMNNASSDKAKQLNFSVDFLIYFNSQLSIPPSMDEFLSKKLLFTEIIRKAIGQCKSWQNGLYDSDLVRRLNISAFNNFNL